MGSRGASALEEDGDHSLVKNWTLPVEARLPWRLSALMIRAALRS